MNSYLAPDWLKCRKVTDLEYARWLNGQATKIWARETDAGRTAFATRGELKQALHSAVHASDGRDPYSGARLFVRHMRADWIDSQAHLKGNRHFLTLRRCMPSFDHVRGLGHKAYELCALETNSAKSFMSPAQFVDLCRRVARHRGLRDTPPSSTIPTTEVPGPDRAGTTRNPEAPNRPHHAAPATMRIREPNRSRAEAADTPLSPRQGCDGSKMPETTETQIVLAARPRGADASRQSNPRRAIAHCMNCGSAMGSADGWISHGDALCDVCNG